MSRYRPPEPRSSPYISRAGFDRLQREHASLWARRADVTAALSAAAAEGDRSENAEYIYRKKELRELDRRIRYLQRRLPALTIVPPRQAASRIYFGAFVVLSFGAGERLQVRLVGADEIDPARHHISIDSPMARALLGKQAGDRVCVSVADRHDPYDVLSVSYECHE